jgi:hypothetical protein
VHEDTVIAEHNRDFGRNQVLYNPWHYVPLLERKPGALRNGAPFKHWDLPDALQTVRNHLMRRLGGDRECVQILTAIQTNGVEAVTVACELALEEKAISADYILNVLSRLRPNLAPAAIRTPDSLCLATEPTANCERYDQLLAIARQDQEGITCSDMK